ncbi:AraC family ligand binding domain-containing protein [Cohnella faecalis]|uniref:AraC family ligand binding domain-containing protein n=1 Tax=Cohnella faecalis TaxID=2315694 RepID=UPI0026886284|nr:AraC family ligand binding domain-containing protein [Cohnella faecalis]
MPDPATYRVASNPVGVEPEELTVLFAGESQTAPNHRAGPKVVDYYLLHHVLSGKGMFQVGEFEAELEAGHSFLIYPRQLVSYTSDEREPWRYLWIAFAGERASALVEKSGLTEERPVVDTGTDSAPKSDAGASTKRSGREADPLPWKPTGICTFCLQRSGNRRSKTRLPLCARTRIARN